MSDNKEVFTQIFATNRWGSSESVSGRGSELRQTEEVRASIADIIAQYGIRTIVDAPSGDFNWMPHVLNQFPDVTYQGFDIVEPIVQSLQEKYSDVPEWQFQTADITHDILPTADLIINRDCLVHLSLSDGQKALTNFALSGSKYLLSTHYPAETVNADTGNGHWRPINLTLPPYNLNAPIEVFDTDFTDNGRNHPGNHLGLWAL